MNVFIVMTAPVGTMIQIYVVDEVFEKESDAIHYVFDRTLTSQSLITKTYTIIEKEIKSANV